MSRPRSRSASGATARGSTSWRGKGKIKEFTGISDPYEAPKTPELKLDTENLDVDYCAQQVILKLENMGLIRA